MYLAAVSGGADSTAMLVAVSSILRQKYPEQFSSGFLLRCLHVDHGMRPPEESGADAEYVRCLCETLNVPCTVVSISHGKIAAAARRMGIGPEAAARLYRMRALNREALRLETSGRRVYVLTAHTHNDLLETALMRVLRGAGPAGLAAMPESRGRMFRPLLHLGRRDALQYLREKNISWREDSTNQDTRFLRNRVRHCLIPALDEYFPRWRAALPALSETQSLAAGFIGDEASARIVWLFSGKNSCRTDAGNFFAQPVIIREEALFQCADMLLAGQAVPAAVRRKNVRRFCLSLPGGQERVAVDMGPVRAFVDGGQVIVRKTRPRISERGFSLLIKEAGLYTLKGVTIEAANGLDSGGETVSSFQARLPLVFRRALKSDCVAEDSGKIVKARAFSGGMRKRLISAVSTQGIAAFIGPEGLLARSAFGAAQNPRDYYTVTIKIKIGGTNVQ